MPARQGAFFGRRKGRPLREQQQELFATLLPELQLDLSRPAPRDLRDLFAARLPPQASLSNPGALFTAPAALAGKVENVRLEIGFGGGEHLLHEAARRPTSGFIGIEPFVNGMAKMLAALAAAPQKAANIRLYHDDALQILAWLLDNSLAGIDIFYPDPWPKKKHWKRRFINAGTLEHFARLLQSGGILRFASDIDSYINQVLQLMRDHKAFSWAAETAKDWQIPYNAWPGTRYEAKARQAGRKPAYLTFIRR
ncbi:MAG: tRNA (guanosine(46)-N7)-methyltransferase TrmB [Candidatus Tokpelaia sp.]|nr:MAG: tRNA (guanosine(46)-N7)-methyltransferase TrmB [Candidatus Tokpelaia sp.]KAA6205344.1 MAG: tRNA (guanosine(46)-N7)-methyltransferase TrmB [Candidatus Tokpelaia sp.]